MDSSSRSKQPRENASSAMYLKALGVLAGIGAICGLVVLRAELREQSRGFLEGEREGRNTLATEAES